MIITIRSVYTSITSLHRVTVCVCVCVCVCVVRTLKIYSLKKFQVYNTVLITTVIMLYIRSLKLIHLKTEDLYSLTCVSPSLPPLSPWWPPFYSLFLRVWLFKEKDSAFRWDHTAFAFLCLTNFTLHSALKFHPFCHKWQDFHIYHIFFIHSSIDGHLGCSHILAILN